MRAKIDNLVNGASFCFFVYYVFIDKNKTMKNDDDFNIPEGDFISGIYNYCDRWCERCIYTSRCMNFEMGKEIEREVKDNKRRKKSIEENKGFWDQVNKTVEEAAELVDEVMPLEDDNIFSFFDDVSYDEDVEEAMKDRKKIREKAKDHNLSKISLKYEEAVHKWFEERKEMLKIEYSEEKYSLSAKYPDIIDDKTLKSISESVEVVMWYHIQIWVKLQRALSGYFEEIEDPYLFEDFPIKDHDGSAFVVLLGIDRSLGAWNNLYGKLLSERESIKPLIRMLLWLRPEVEKLFPKARGFEWPPKEF